MKTLIDKYQPVFADSKTATSMPFFDGTTLVFCQSSGTVKTTIATTGTIWKTISRNKALAEKFKNLPRSQQVTYRPWKMAYCDWNDKTVRPIVTGLPENRPERSPAFYREGSRVHLSFISGGPTSAGFHYRLYTCDGPDLAHLEPPQPISKPPLFFGFVSPLHICWGAGNIVQLAEKATDTTLRLATSFYRVAAVTFLTDDPAKLLITGIINKEHECQTVLYESMTGKVSDVSTEGHVYKSSLHRNHLVFAKKSQGGFEERELYHGDCKLSSSAIKITQGE